MVRRCAGTQQQNLRHPVRVAVHLGDLAREPHCGNVRPQVGTGWGKWSGGVLARNGKIYGIPSQSTSILEIDVNSRITTTYGHGVIPGGGHLEDKWNGGVLGPNGVLASRPLMRHRRASLLVHCLHPARRQDLRHPMAQQLHPRVRSGDHGPPSLRAAAHRNQLHLASRSRRLACAVPELALPPSDSTPRSGGRHGGVCISNGRILAVPYNSAQILEIGERVCMPSDATNGTSSTVMLQPAFTVSQSLSSMLMPVPVAAANVRTQTFLLALPGCPDSNNGAPSELPACALTSVIVTRANPHPRAPRRRVLHLRSPHLALRDDHPYEA